MEKLKNDINEAKKICSNSFYTNDNIFIRLYPFTTENISGYIEQFKLKNKSLLTVGSSLDQVFNAILYECKDITVLDINPFVKYYYFLKLASIINLDREEFLKFICYKEYSIFRTKNKDSFDKNIFNQIKEDIKILDYDSYYFWEELFLNYKNNKIRSRLFLRDENSKKVIENCNSYLKNNEEYNKLKKELNDIDIKFINDNLLECELKQKYDNIWLSNVGQYISLEELKSLVDKLNNNLNIDGQMLITYLYNLTTDHKYCKDWYPIYDLKRTREILKKYKTDYKNFVGIESIKHKDESVLDGVLIYRKK